MLKFGIIGYPLEHSLSPVMQNAALQYLNINGEYKAYEIKEEELKETVKRLINDGLKGFNVTIPHKIKIIPLLDELTDIAKQVGAVNTVTINNGKTIGDNTDVIGFWEATSPDIRNNLKGKDVSILGCGGSAYAVCTALILNNAKNIKIYGRNKNKLEGFKKHFVKTPQCGVSTTHIEINLLNNIDLSNASMLVNTTPVGMHPDVNNSLIAKNILEKLPQDAIVYDIIYNPPETKLLKDAKSLDKITINGIEMLIRQGAASLAKWIEIKEPPLGVMRLAIGLTQSSQGMAPFAPFPP